jgi:hypothetical protein
MGGGAFTAELLPIGAAAWCTGKKVVQDLNDLFHASWPLKNRNRKG